MTNADCRLVDWLINIVLKCSNPNPNPKRLVLGLIRVRVRVRIRAFYNNDYLSVCKFAVCVCRTPPLYRFNTKERLKQQRRRRYHEHQKSTEWVQQHISTCTTYWKLSTVSLCNSRFFFQQKRITLIASGRHLESKQNIIIREVEPVSGEGRGGEREHLSSPSPSSIFIPSSSP